MADVPLPKPRETRETQAQPTDSPQPLVTRVLDYSQHQGDAVRIADTPDRIAFREAAKQNLQLIFADLQSAKQHMLATKEFFRQGQGPGTDVYKESLRQGEISYFMAQDRADKFLYEQVPLFDRLGQPVMGRDAQGRPVQLTTPKIDEHGRPVLHDRGRAVVNELRLLDQQVQQLRADQSPLGRQQFQLVLAERNAMNDLLRASGYTRANHGLAILFARSNYQEPKQTDMRIAGLAELDRAAVFDPLMEGIPNPDPNQEIRPDANYIKHLTSADPERAQRILARFGQPQATQQTEVQPQPQPTTGVRSGPRVQLPTSLPREGNQPITPPPLVPPPLVPPPTGREIPPPPVRAEVQPIQPANIQYDAWGVSEAVFPAEIRAQLPPDFKGDQYPYPTKISVKGFHLRAGQLVIGKNNGYDDPYFVLFSTQAFPSAIDKADSLDRTSLMAGIIDCAKVVNACTNTTDQQVVAAYIEKIEPLEADKSLRKMSIMALQQSNWGQAEAEAFKSFFDAVRSEQDIVGATADTRNMAMNESIINDWLDKNKAQADLLQKHPKWAEMKAQCVEYMNRTNDLWLAKGQLTADQKKVADAQHELNQLEELFNSSYDIRAKYLMKLMEEKSVDDFMKLPAEQKETYLQNKKQALEVLVQHESVKKFIEAVQGSPEQTALLTDPKVQEALALKAEIVCIEEARKMAREMVEINPICGDRNSDQGKEFAPIIDGLGINLAVRQNTPVTSTVPPTQTQTQERPAVQPPPIVPPPVVPPPVTLPPETPPLTRVADGQTTPPADQAREVQPPATQAPASEAQNPLQILEALTTEFNQARDAAVRAAAALPESNQESLDKAAAAVLQQFRKRYEDCVALADKRFEAEGARINKQRAMFADLFKLLLEGKIEDEIKAVEAQMLEHVSKFTAEEKADYAKLETNIPEQEKNTIVWKLSNKYPEFGFLGLRRAGLESLRESLPETKRLRADQIVGVDGRGGELKTARDKVTNENDKKLLAVFFGDTDALTDMGAIGQILKTQHPDIVTAVDSKIAADLAAVQNQDHKKLLEELHAAGTAAARKNELRLQLATQYPELVNLSDEQVKVLTQLREMVKQKYPDIQRLAQEYAIIMEPVEKLRLEWEEAQSKELLAASMSTYNFHFVYADALSYGNAQDKELSKKELITAFKYLPESLWEAAKSSPIGEGIFKRLPNVTLDEIKRIISEEVAQHEAQIAAGGGLVAKGQVMFDEALVYADTQPFTEVTRKKFEDAIKQLDQDFDIKTVQELMTKEFEKLEKDEQLKRELDQLKSEGKLDEFNRRRNELLTPQQRLEIHVAFNQGMAMLKTLVDKRIQYIGILRDDKNKQYADAVKVAEDIAAIVKTTFNDQMIDMLKKESDLLSLHLEARPNPNDPDDLRTNWECALSQEERTLLTNMRQSIVGGKLEITDPDGTVKSVPTDGFNMLPILSLRQLALLYMGHRTVRNGDNLVPEWGVGQFEDPAVINPKLKPEERTDEQKNRIQKLEAAVQEMVDIYKKKGIPINEAADAVLQALIKEAPSDVLAQYRKQSTFTTNLLADGLSGAAAFVAFNGIVFALNRQAGMALLRGESRALVGTSRSMRALAYTGAAASAYVTRAGVVRLRTGEFEDYRETLAHSAFGTTVGLLGGRALSNGVFRYRLGQSFLGTANAELKVTAELLGTAEGGLSTVGRFKDALARMGVEVQGPLGEELAMLAREFPTMTFEELARIGKGAGSLAAADVEALANLIKANPGKSLTELATEFAGSRAGMAANDTLATLADLARLNRTMPAASAAELAAAAVKNNTTTIMGQRLLNSMQGDLLAQCAQHLVGTGFVNERLMVEVVANATGTGAEQLTVGQFKDFVTKLCTEAETAAAATHGGVAKIPGAVQQQLARMREVGNKAIQELGTVPNDKLMMNLVQSKMVLNPNWAKEFIGKFAPGANVAAARSPWLARMTRFNPLSKIEPINNPNALSQLSWANTYRSYIEALSYVTMYKTSVNLYEERDKKPWWQTIVDTNITGPFSNASKLSGQLFEQAAKGLDVRGNGITYTDAVIGTSVAYLGALLELPIGQATFVAPFTGQQQNLRVPYFSPYRGTSRIDAIKYAGKQSGHAAFTSFGGGLIYPFAERTAANIAARAPIALPVWNSFVVHANDAQLHYYGAGFRGTPLYLQPERNPVAEQYYGDLYRRSLTDPVNAPVPAAPDATGAPAQTVPASPPDAATNPPGSPTPAWRPRTGSRVVRPKTE